MRARSDLAVQMRCSGSTATNSAATTPVIGPRTYGPFVAKTMKSQAYIAPTNQSTAESDRINTSGSSYRAHPLGSGPKVPMRKGLASCLVLIVYRPGTSAAGSRIVQAGRPSHDTAPFVRLR